MGYAQIIMNFIWDQTINIIMSNLCMLIFVNFKNVIKRLLCKNNYINKYFIKHKKGLIKHIAQLDIHNVNKNLITDSYEKLLNYIHANDKFSIRKIINNHNALITSYNLIADCELKLNKNIHINITNTYEKNTGTIISTIELFSYTETNEKIQEFVDKI
jgi:hypothetical protein